MANSLYSINKNPSPSLPKSGIFSGRVLAVIINDQDYPDVFRKYGEWDSMGMVVWSDPKNPSNKKKALVNQNIAHPLFPNSKYLPVENEMVYIISLPNNNGENSQSQTTYYYFHAINAWGSVNCNAIPDGVQSSNKSKTSTQSNQQVEAGNFRRSSNEDESINLGNTFEESPNVKNTQLFEGDVIHEGRFGQNLRFGSTVKNSNPENPWSKVGDNGDPIIILKNGQYDDDNDAWIPQVEDINKDKSSIYLTSTQEIPIEASSTSYDSYGTSKPTSPNKFSGEQVILNSGRLLFNSKTDSILFSSKDSINLNSVNSVNIDTPKTIVQSGEVLLGNQNATEPIILGDKFLTDFNLLLTDLVSLCTALPTVGTPAPFTPNVAVAGAATQVLVRAQSIQGKIQSYKSKVTKSK